MDLAISAFAARQHGLVTLAQLHAAGLSDSAVKKRVDRGALRRRARGVYSLGPLSRQGELLAAVLAAGPGALLSHWAAAELHGLIKWRASFIDVVVPRKRQSSPGTRYRRATIHWRDRTDRDDIPVTSVARLLVDLTDVVRVPHEITAVIHQAAYNGAYSLLATQDARQRANGRRHVALLDEAIALYEAGSAGTRSRGEIHALALLDAQGLPRPIVNTTFLGEEVDFHWPHLKLIVELDGPPHTRPPSRRSDAERDELFRNAGYELIRVPEPEDVATRIGCALSSDRRGLP
ncbi:type IV toxin-antitoxin system AbiEi family antitoxin domain-containing protein [Solirubrobacter phytolaccae]|uniref:Type IV toxin-antitoxin system AbiEi family antitoxin domain-containing protein n=1 Tax=Solirubrobacter phytolaccae TaxID=1404360 RepID=A0A9X3S797_9ACTN|nr:type IV toxin-antitoxin system AbiEi family antitoxin domain-containing protein [Solirubrobacter phytolaccae]MDA0180033.1 type IV toxin-antitoxin system AbiEi family antitoxin domain-containing protein [Solirubrobacter phytolaccae]